MNIPKKNKTIFTISKTAQNNGIKNPHQLHLRTGISFQRSKRLWIGSGKIHLEDLDALCDAIPCAIKDLIQRIPDQQS